MKTSKYNYITNKTDYSYWYNGVNHNFFRLPIALGKKIQNMMDSSESISQLPYPIYQKLLDNGFIINDDANELALIRKKNEETINEKKYWLTILPTLNCNFKCWYCIQDHIATKMSEDTIESIKNHLLYMMDIEKVESVKIEWFGGEPFMFFNQVIRPICEFAKKECEKRSIPYISTATTNGYYLSPSIIKDLEKLNFKKFQITLDGCKEEHDKVKYQKNCASAFVHVLTNINSLITSISDIEIILRINYTDNNLNLKLVDEVNSIISPENRRNVYVMPQKVWQEKNEKNRYCRVSELISLFRSSGYNTIRSGMISNFVPCYTNRKYYNTINYNGDVSKCTACNVLYEDKVHGKIAGNGSIIWDKEFIRKFEIKSYENEKCLNCNYLPICMGTCPRNYDPESHFCKYDAEDMIVEDMLVNTIEDYYYNELAKEN